MDCGKYCALATSVNLINVCLSMSLAMKEILFNILLVIIDDFVGYHSYISDVYITLNWWKGKPSGSIACTWKQQPWFYLSCSSVVMNDATPLTPPSAWAELHLQMLTPYMYSPWSLRTRKILLHNDVVRGDILQPPHRHLTPYLQINTYKHQTTYL